MSQVTARTSLGDLTGEAVDGIVRFRTVPYATPPVGDLRFAPPKPMAAWTGVLDASSRGPIAPQPTSRLALAMGHFERAQSEDCLTLAITTPAIDGRRPVIVWLHGGAYLSGAGSLDWYDGGPLTKSGGVVVVGVNYRLGPLGFLRFPGLADGRMGMRDIALALRFVRDHIAAFGGDPDRVTVMGQSAGGAAIMRLLDDPATEGLFHRVIVQSGPARPGLDPAEATKRGRRFAQLLDLDPDAQDAGEQLRRMPAAPLIAKQMVLAGELSSFGAAVPAFQPCADEARPFDAERIARTIAARNIAMVIGTTREEMHAFYAGNPAMRDPDQAAVAAWFEKLTGRAETIDTYARHRPSGTRLDLFSDLMTDHQFLLGSLDLARRVVSNNGTAFVYQFDWCGPNSPWKACHTIELPFTFGTLPAWDAPMLQGLDQATHRSLSGTMMAAWCAFAHGGDPSLPDLAWPSYGPGRETMCFGPIVGVMGDPAGLAWKIGA